MKRFLFLFALLALTSFYSKGQSFNYDVEFESKPYLDIHKFDLENTVGIKKKILLKTDLVNGSETDTIKIYEYDKYGNEVSKIGFEDNKRNLVILTEWEGDLIVQIKSYKAPKFNLSMLNKYKYGEDNNLIELLSLSIINKDTVSYYCKQFLYDSNENLIEKRLYRSGFREALFKKYEQKAIFEYNKKGLLTKNIHLSGQNKNFPYSRYFYTKNLLDSIVSFSHTDSSDNKYDYNHFRYNKNGSLIYKAAPIKLKINNEPGGVKVDEYTYDKEGFLTHAHTRRKEESVVKVDYHYQNGKIHEVIATNGNPKYASSIYFFYPSYVKVIRDVYIRNKYGHVIRKERYFDGQLSQIIESIYTYY